MKLVFVHDGPVYLDENGKYYEYAFHGLYERYRYLADEITFLMRVEPMVSGERYDLVPEKIHVVGFKNFKSPTSYFKYRRSAEKTITEEIENADIVILRDSSAASIAMKYTKKYGIPYLRECVGCSWDSLWNYSLLGKVLAPVFFLRQRKEIKESPYVYYVTEKFLQNRYPTHGKWVGCSDVVVKIMNEDALKERLRKLRNFNKDEEISLGTAAAIDVRYKGQEYVISAIKLLKERGYKIKYYLAGGNKNNSTYLQECAKKNDVVENVVFCGALNKEDIMRFYDNIDVYIQPSKQEGLPRSIIEAMSRGCPVLGTNIAGIPELIDRDCLFKKGSSKAIAESINRIINRDMRKYAKRNFEKAKEYTVDKLDKRRKKFYDEFLDEYFT